MFRLAALLLLALAALPCVALAAGTQALTIDLRGGTPRIDKLERYETGTPLTVTVTAPSAESAMLAGVGPDGSNLRAPLARGADGAFTATVTLATPGTWSLATSTSANGETVSTESFALTVSDAPSPVGAAVMAALSFVSIAGGIGLIAVKRRTLAPAG